MSKKKKVLMMVLAALIGLLLLACAAFYVVFDVPNWQKLDASKLSALAQTSSMYDAQGELMSELRGAENRNIVSLDEIPMHTRQAFLAAEDLRFYEHRGIDVYRILGALRSNIKNGTLAEGASTITQQLAKLTHLSSEKTIRRKLEAVGNVRKAHSGTGNRAVHAFDMRGRVAETEEQHHHGGDNQTHNQRDFDHGEPEFRLAEHSHGYEVHTGERHEEAQFDKPFPRVEVNAERAEERDEIGADGRDFGHAGQDEHDPVRPAGEFAPRAAEVAGDEVDEGVLAWVAVHHFADGAHQEEHDDTDQNVHEDDRGAG